MPDDIGDWYRRQDTEARRLSALLDQRRAEGADPEELKRLEEALERARYVGD